MAPEQERGIVEDELMAGDRDFLMDEKIRLENRNAELSAALQNLLSVEESWCDLNQPCVRGDLDAAMAQARAALEI